MNKLVNGESKYYYNATIWSGRNVQPMQGWFSVVDGRFATIASGELPTDFQSDEAVNLHGRHVLPGLVDCHSHLTVSAWIPYTLDGSAWKNKTHMLQDIAKYSEKLSSDAWVIGFYADFFKVGKLPDQQALNEACGGRPLLIMDFSLHKSLASEAAFERANIARMKFSDGDVQRNTRGIATGLLKETANGHALSIALTEFAQQFESLQMLALMHSEANRHIALGIVECHDPCMHPKLQSIAEKFTQQTPLKFSWSHVTSHEHADFVAENVCLSCGSGPKSAKMFLDGADECAICLKPSDVLKMSALSVGQALTGNTDALRTLTKTKLTYRNGRVRTPFMRLPKEQLTHKLADLGEQEVRPKIHALGNEAVSCACQGLVESGVKDATVEHLVLLSNESIEQVAQSGAVASLQPGFLQQAKELASSNIHKVLNVIPAQSLSEAGVPIALSSDNPCGPLDPLANIRRAVTRTSDDGLIIDPKESITISQAIQAYSIGGQQAIHGKPGQGIEADAPANFIVISGHPEHSYSEVMQTWIDGQCVYSRGELTMV